MNAKSLTVIAQIKAKPGKEDQVRQELLSLVAPSPSLRVISGVLRS